MLANRGNSLRCCVLLFAAVMLRLAPRGGESFVLNYLQMFLSLPINKPF
jgi:hypothetical protein